MARLLLVAALALLAGCERFPGIPPNETGVLNYDWIPADPRPAPPPLYCYATLATPECFAQPIPGRPLLGLYGRDPPPVAASEARAQSAPPESAPPAPPLASEPRQAVPVTPVEPAPLAPEAPPRS
jgi:hypothetical protein